MPRIKQSDDLEKDNIVRAYIAKYMALYMLTDEQVAIKLRCNKRTFQNKKKRPSTFSLGELRKLATVLKLNKDECAEFIILGGK